MCTFTRPTGLIAFYIAICVVSAGCGSDKSGLVPVSGQVLIDGQPLSLGSLQVMPTGARPAFGKLDENGHFELMTYKEGDGCVSGSHRVTITAFEVVPGRRQKWHAPKKYSNPSTSDVVIEISGATKDLEINLTWDGGKPFVESFAGG
ncbi:hypothetical protein [Aeoliella mucimassa]|uniref:Carboxypeptidase regulatory-like domain-containing protein n=1 Tax=Aeoliella mucimassa TaxID=2527972 RepID=A0A518APP2_9BACT|nr:hypothetical protein [Aeoliella mucimassa]QDU56699.1 hypothetical protein Pan181_29090 [Aeoliella mucimassa]